MAKIADNLLPSGFENKMPELDVFRSWTIGPNMELFREFEEDSLDVISGQSLNLQEGSDTLLAIFRLKKNSTYSGLNTCQNCGLDFDKETS